MASTHEAVKNIHPDWNESKVDEEVNLIRYELGITLDNPQNLPNLTGFDDDDAEKENKQDDSGDTDVMINKIERDKQKKEKRSK